MRRERRRPAPGAAPPASLARRLADGARRWLILAVLVGGLLAALAAIRAADRPTVTRERITIERQYKTY